jgi:hypothetical protein
MPMTPPMCGGLLVHLSTLGERLPAGISILHILGFVNCALLYG